MKANSIHNSQPLPLFCPNCEAERVSWIPKHTNVKQEFRGELFEIPSTVQLCSQCGYEYWDDQTNEKIVHETWNAYREKNNLLSSQEIIRIRKDWDMTQKEFADALGVGEASIKRWERGLVQDKSHDELIRAKAREQGTHYVSYQSIFDYIKPSQIDPLPELKSMGSDGSLNWKVTILPIVQNTFITPPHSFIQFEQSKGEKSPLSHSSTRYDELSFTA